MIKNVFFVFAVTLLMGVGTAVASASTDMDNPQEMTVTYDVSMDSAESKSLGYTKTYEWLSGSGVQDPAPTDYAKFTITQKSFVKIATSFTSDKSYNFPDGASEVVVYSNPGYTVELTRLTFDNKSVFLEMDEGTYYVKTLVKSSYGFSYSFTGNITICAVSEESGVQIQQKVGKGNTVTVTVSADGLGGTSSVKLVEGTTSSWSSVEDLQNNQVVLTKNGTYTVRIVTGNNQTILRTIQVTGIDTVKPTIKGVKNGKTYAKVTIKFSDKGSGIKKATLNGKTIKSGTKVTKKGSYTVKVWDNAGNVKTVKFIIK